MSVNVKALRALLDKATPGPWRIYTDPKGRTFGTLYVLDPMVKPGDGCAIASDICDSDGRSSRENAALIVAAVNALPALLALAEAVRELAGPIAMLAEHGDIAERDAARRVTAILDGK